MSAPNTPEEAIYKVVDAVRAIANRIPAPLDEPITRADLQETLLQIAEELERFELDRTRA